MTKASVSLVVTSVVLAVIGLPTMAVAFLVVGFLLAASNGFKLLSNLQSTPTLAEIHHKHEVRLDHRMSIGVEVATKSDGFKPQPKFYPRENN